MAPPSMAWENFPKSGGGRELIGVLNIGDDLGSFPHHPWLDRAQAHDPVAAPGGAGPAHNLELDIAAQGMPLQCVGDTQAGDFVDSASRPTAPPSPLAESPIPPAPGAQEGLSLRGG